MPTYFVTRHSGAREWAARRGHGEAHVIAHLDPALIRPGDMVMGTLPVHLAAEVCARGAHFLFLVLDTPPELRGRDLTADEMEKCGARLAGYRITPDTQAEASTSP
jgi:CRISPR-associated protein Csx16